MSPLPPILARDYAIHRVRATGCFFAFGAAGTAIAVALMAVLWICK
jgi:hypothetical protein